MSFKNFIYVFDETDKANLLSLGFVLIKEDKRQGVYVFKNDKKNKFNKNDFQFVLSDTLTF